ncbi:iron-containing alcohol dehydrogenase [Microlunatus ginsengisoli]|uniref:Iron-containing alcohol dehydrogenase n=1 Tax=Microlunatus ginsengisoli TaxID=363863 RepID=A0ABP6ZTP0_9ACTN
MTGRRFDLAVPADIRFGAGRVAELPAALAALGTTRAYVVTGRSSERADALRAELAAAKIESAVFAVPGEPTIEICRAAVAGLRQAGCDGVVGFGGGSALDVAKAVAVLAPSGSDPLDHLEVIGAGRPIVRPGLPCVAVPTTAGTGSEVTRNAVLSGDGVKASLRSPLMLPRVAIVDPDLLAGVPRGTIAASGLDALAQVIEPLLSRRANPFTDALARDGIRRSARSLRTAYAEGMVEPRVREDLALASLFGGLCLANSSLGIVHGLAAALGARLSAPHGAVCAATLAAAVDVNGRALRARQPESPALDRLDELGTLLTGDPAARAAQAVDWLAALTRTLEVPGLRTYGLVDESVDAVVAAAQRASSTKGNPIDLTDREVSEIVHRAL